MAPSRRNSIPSYRRHKQSNQAIVTIRLPDGKRKDILLGPWRSAESKKEYARIVGELQVSHTSHLPKAIQHDLTVNECLVPFLRHCDQYYRHPNGKATGHTDLIKQAVRPLADRYGHTSAKDFGPLALKAIQQHWIDRGITRRTINQYSALIKQFFKWCVAEEMIPAGILEGLRAVPGLRIGRSQAAESPPVKPADPSIVTAALPFMPPAVRALVEIQSLCAARGSELLVLRVEDIDRSGDVWIYTPKAHKNSHRGKSRRIFFGPQCQAILKPWIEKTPEGEYIFNPRRGEVERIADNSARRKTPRYPSHMRRNKLKRAKVRLRPPLDRYDRTSYARAVARACEQAFPTPERFSKEQGKAWRKKHHFSPHQLRHLAATNIRKEHGIEMARILLGHSTAFTTEIYAEVDTEKAKQIVSKIG